MSRGVKAEQKERTHATILNSAAKLLRTRGIAGASVAEVMTGAGLTVGGFYAHFASKEKLVDASLRKTLTAARERLFGGLDVKPAEQRTEVMLKRYLTTASRDNIDSGCTLPSVVGEVGTIATEHRGVMLEHFGALATEIEASLPPRTAVGRRQTALAILALMYGGLSLARALRGTAMSDEILKATRTMGAALAHVGEQEAK